MSVAPWITDKSANVPTARRRSGKNRGLVSTAPTTSLFAQALGHMGGFALLAFVSYGFVSLMGHTMKSSAYRERVAAEFRVDAARTDVLQRSSQVASLASTADLDRWAEAQGFSRPGTTARAENGKKTSRAIE